MAWKADLVGSGWIGVGKGELISQAKDADNEEVLAAGKTVVVSNMTFKLVRKS
jgi:hypothetical protein